MRVISHTSAPGWLSPSFLSNSTNKAPRQHNQVWCDLTLGQTVVANEMLTADKDHKLRKQAEWPTPWDWGKGQSTGCGLPCSKGPLIHKMTLQSGYTGDSFQPRSLLEEKNPKSQQWRLGEWGYIHSVKKQSTCSAYVQIKKGETKYPQTLVVRTAGFVALGAAEGNRCERGASRQDDPGTQGTAARASWGAQQDKGAIL